MHSLAQLNSKAKRHSIESSVDGFQQTRTARLKEEEPDFRLKQEPPKDVRLEGSSLNKHPWPSEHNTSTTPPQKSVVDEEEIKALLRR